jgi:hypothetical protein
MKVSHSFAKDSIFRNSDEINSGTTFFTSMNGVSSSVTLRLRSMVSSLNFTPLYSTFLCSSLS